MKLEHFEGSELVVIEVGGHRAFTAETIGKALEYERPGDAINKIHRRSEEEFEQGIDWDWYDTETHQNGVSKEGRYTRRIYYQTGVYVIGMRSDQPKATTFRRWAKHVLAETQAEATENPLAYTLEGMEGGFEQKCKICMSSMREYIEGMLTHEIRKDDGEHYRYGDIVNWAAERGLRLSESGLSRHNNLHRLPKAVPRQIMDNPELALALLAAKLSDIAQRRALETLPDREVVKYLFSSANTLMAYRSSNPRLLPPPDDLN